MKINPRCCPDPTCGWYPPDEDCRICHQFDPLALEKESLEAMTENEWEEWKTRIMEPPMEEKPTPPTQPPNPEGQASLLKDLVRHLVGVETPSDRALTYRWVKSGIYEVRQGASWLVVKKIVPIPPEVTIAGMTDDLEEGFIFGLPKIPWEVYTQLVTFFRAIHQTMGLEAYAQIWWSPEEQRYDVVVPPQENTSTHVDHGGVHLWEGWRLIADIHSHHTMGAFFSGTDDKDESRVDRLYGVVGSIDQVIPATLWRVRSGNSFHPVRLDQIFDSPTIPQTVTFQTATACGVQGGSKVGQVTFTVALDPFAGVHCPDAWLTKVKKDTPPPFLLTGEGGDVGKGQAGETDPRPFRPGVIEGGVRRNQQGRFTPSQQKLSKAQKKQKRLLGGSYYMEKDGVCYLVHPDGVHEPMPKTWGQRFDR